MENSDILSIIDPLLGGHPAGTTEYTACCPFHSKEDGSKERSPSFGMSLETGLFFCHSCHASGNLRSFLRRMGVSAFLLEHVYGSLLEKLSAHVKTGPAHDPLRPKVFDENPIKEALLGLFEHDVGNLLTGFSPSTLRHFDIGWDGWHGRITFPIRDLKGKLSAISGRAVYKEQRPRYKVYDKEYRTWDLPERVGWLKGTVIWNSHDVLPALHRARPGEAWVIVVEGFKAAMHIWQLGYPNVIALLGSHMTPDQKWILERFHARVLLFLDNNKPGKTGCAHAARELSNSLDTYIINYPDRLIDFDEAQPDLLTFDELQYQVCHPVTYNQWYLNQRNS